MGTDIRNFEEGFRVFIPDSHSHREVPEMKIAGVSLKLSNYFPKPR